jgi:hypothetical protein
MATGWFHALRDRRVDLIDLIGHLPFDAPVTSRSIRQRCWQSGGAAP